MSKKSFSLPTDPNFFGSVIGISGVFFRPNDSSISGFVEMGSGYLDKDYGIALSQSSLDGLVGMAFT